MARVSGPLLSIAASGTFADLLTFATQLGRTVAKKKGSPTGEPTLLQRSTRIAFLFFQQSFLRDLTQADRDTWLPTAAANLYSSHNAFSAKNMACLNRNQGPQQTPFINTTDVAPTFTTLYSCSGGAGTIQHDFDVLAPNDGWCAVARRDFNPPIDATHAPIVRISLLTAAGPQTFIDHNVPPGNYRMLTKIFRKNRPQSFTLRTSNIIVT